MSFRSHSSDIKEGFVVSGSGTVLSEFAEEEFQDGKTHHPGAYSILPALGLRDYFLSDNVNLEDLSLSQIDLSTIIEAFKYEGDPQHFDKEAYVTNVAKAVGLNPIQLFQTFEELASAKQVSAKQASAVAYVKDTAIALGVDKIYEDALGVDLTTMTKGVNQFSEVETFKKETFEKTVAEEDGIASTKIPQAFEEDVNTKKTRIEAITEDMAASLGVNLTTVTEALRKVTHEQGSVDKETLAKYLAVEMGFDSTTIFKALDRGIDVQDLDEDSFLRIINKTAGIEDSHYNHVKNKVGGNFEDLEAILASSTTSANVESFTRAILNSRNLKSLTVKDLPERIKEKMLSLLRSQREKSLKKRRLPGMDNLGESHADKELRKGKINCGKFEASSTVLVEHNSVF